MKRLLFLTLSLFAMMGSAWADHWSVSYTPSAGDTQTETYVYAILQLPSADADGAWTNYYVPSGAGSKYEIAAFIGDEVRAVETTPSFTNRKVETYAEMSVWRFRVVGGESEVNETITFKVYNSSSNAEYSVTAKTTFSGETGDIPSNPLIIQLSEPTSLSLSDFTLNVGETKNLLDVITVTPTGATLPENLEWIRPADEYSITDNVLTALAPAKNGVNINLQALGTVTSAKVTILQPATSLTLKGDAEVTLEAGDGAGLWAFLNSCYTILPANTTDKVTWTSANEGIVGMPPSVSGYEYDLVPLAGGTTILTGTAHDGMSIQVTVHVIVPVLIITTPFGVSADGGSVTYLECSVGDDLTSYFVDGKAFSVSPDDATNKNVTFSVNTDGDIVPVEISGGKILAKSEGDAVVRVTAADGSNVYCDVNIRVHNDVQTITAKEETISVSIKDSPVDISDKVTANLTVSPDGAMDFYNGIEAETDDDDMIIFGDQMAGGGQVLLMAMVNNAGEATITITYHVKNYLASTFSADGGEVVEDKTVSFTVVASAGLYDLSLGFSEEQMIVDEPLYIYVHPVPEEAEDFDYTKLSLTGSVRGCPDGWMSVDVVSTEYDEESNSCTMMITPRYPGSLVLKATYDDGTDNGISETSDPQKVAVEYNYNEGWYWSTMYYGDVANMSLTDLFGDANDDGRGLVEIRTENEEMLNDPEYGYFGDVNLLAQNRCFKIQVNEIVSVLMESGQLWQTEDVNLHKGWNWIPNPYFYNRSLANAFGEGFTPSEGDRIMSKDEGFADYNGTAWIGTLNLLSRGQGYLYFSNADDVLIPYADESEMAGVDDFDPSISVPARRKAIANTPFTYNPSRFRDNMGIVAEIDGVQMPEQYSVVAFVGDECRGEGRCVEGKMFITVHANAGELVNFMLLDNTTGDLFPIDQTVRFGSMLGSLKSPFHMTAEAVVTGVNAVHSSEFEVQSYDLGGRRVANSQKGISIQRSQNGTVKKVVK